MMGPSQRVKKILRPAQHSSDREISATFRATFSRQIYVMHLLLSFFFFHHFLFNDRLEQRDLGNYKTDLHQIFRVGRHAGVDVQYGIGFAIGQGTMPW